MPWAHLAGKTGLEVRDLSQPGYYADLSARLAGPEVAKSIVDVWLASEFDPAGSSAENVKAIDKLDVVNRNPSGC